MKIQSLNLNATNEEENYHLYFSANGTWPELKFIIEFLKACTEKNIGQEDQSSEEDDGHENECVIECRYKKRQKV